MKVQGGIRVRLLGEISEVEKNEILLIQERMLGLRELVPSLYDNNLNNEEIQEILVKIDEDKKNLEKVFKSKWVQLITKYHWKIEEDIKLGLNFSTNEVFIDI